MVNSNTLSEVFSSRQEVQQALSQLRDAGFPMAQVFHIAKGAEFNKQLGGADMTNRAGNW